MATGKENEVSLTSEQIHASDDVLHAYVSNLEFERFLHYNSKLSICFDAFASQVGYQPVEYIGQKHVVDALPALSEGIFKDHSDFMRTLVAVSADTSDEAASISSLFEGTGA